MGINVGNEQVIDIRLENLPILAVYFEIEKIWPLDVTPPVEEIMSCYALGYWVDEYPWTDDTPWTD